MSVKYGNHQITVDHVTGGLRIEVVDLVLASVGPDIVFARVHDSLRNLDHNHGCRFPFDDRLLFDADGSVRHVHASGDEVRFVPAPGEGYSPTTSFNLETLSAEAGGTWRVVYLDGSSSAYRGDGRLASVVDPFGNTLRYSWWGAGDGALVETITDALGRQVNMSNVDAGDGTSRWVFTDWSGRSWSYHWTGYGAGYLRAYTDPEGNTTTYGSPEATHSAFSGIATITLPDGTVALEVEPVGGSPLSTKVGRLTFANGLIVRYTYDWTNRITTVDESGRVTQVQYNANQDITRVSDPDGNVWTYSYDGAHNLIQVVDPRLAVQTYTYDARGNVLTDTDALGNTRTYTYSPTSNKLTTITQPAPFGYVTTLSYDPATGALISVADDEGLRASISYTASGLPSHLTDANGNSTFMTYDGSGNLIEVTDALGRAISLGYDVLGRPTRVADGLGRVSSMAYNRNDIPIAMTDAAGATTTTLLDACSQPVRVTDPANRTTQVTYGLMGEVRFVRDATGRDVSLDYDTLLRLKAWTNGNGQAWSCSYDSLDRPTQLADPLGRSIGWTYDPYCGTTTQVDAVGRELQLLNDVLCRPSQVLRDDGSRLEAVYDELSRRTAVHHYAADTTAPDQSIAYAYDSRGRVSSITQSRPDGDRSISLSHDAGGRLTGMSDLTGATTSYSYLENNLLSSATRAGRTVSYSYNAANELASTTLPNGIICDLAYDHAGNLERMSYTAASGDVIVVLTYATDHLGNRTMKSVAWGPGPAYGVPAYGRATYGARERLVDYYTYDARGQLVGSTLGGRHVYDGNGNRIASFKDGASRPATFDAADGLVSYGDTAYEYTAGGDLASRFDGDRGLVRYAFGLDGNLQAVDLGGGSSTTFAYDGPSGLLERVQPATGSPVRLFNLPLGMGSALHELDESDEVVSSYFLVGDRIVGRCSSEGSLWLLTDALGSVIGVTDDSGSLISRFDYDAWGNLLPTSYDHVPGGWWYRFVGSLGCRYEPTVGFTYMRARWYDAETGRFVGRDSLWAGNLFAYVGSAPAQYVDPLGLQGQEAGSGGNGGSVPLSHKAFLLVKSAGKWIYENPLEAVLLVPIPPLEGYQGVKGMHTVYVVIKEERVVYVGITKCMAVRERVQSVRFGKLSIVSSKLYNLAEVQARAIETYLIRASRAGGKVLENKILSLSPMRKGFAEAMRWAEDYVARYMK